MTLSGRVALLRSDVDTLAAVPLGIVTHVTVQVDNRAGKRRMSAGNSAGIGEIDEESGAYRTAVARMTAAERREAGLRRNGRPKRL